jgi:hypothetical protein
MKREPAHCLWKLFTIAAMGILGVGIGVFLTLAGLMAAETGGYGSALFLLVYSAPFGFFGPVILIGPVLLWTFLGALAGGVEVRAVRATLTVLLAAHYMSIPVLLATADNIWGAGRMAEAFRSGGLLLIFSIPLYLICHVLLVRNAILLESRKNAAGA